MNKIFYIWIIVGLFGVEWAYFIRNKSRIKSAVIMWSSSVILTINLMINAVKSFSEFSLITVLLILYAMVCAFGTVYLTIVSNKGLLPYLTTNDLVKYYNFISKKIKKEGMLRVVDESSKELLIGISIDEFQKHNKITEHTQKYSSVCLGEYIEEIIQYCYDNKSIVLICKDSVPDMVLFNRVSVFELFNSFGTEVNK